MNNQQIYNSGRTNKIRGILLEHAHFNSSVTRYSAIYVHSSLPLTSFTCSSSTLRPPTDLRVVRLPGWPGTTSVWSERVGAIWKEPDRRGTVRKSCPIDTCCSLFSTQFYFLKTNIFLPGQSLEMLAYSVNKRSILKRCLLSSTH